MASYVDLLLKEWKLREASPVLQKCMRKVLNELTGQALLQLRNEPRLQVVCASDGFDVWAYFPVSLRFKRTVVDASKIKLRDTTRILLVMNDGRIQQQKQADTCDHLRDHLGHVLLYLKSPRANNDCDAAMKEWANSAIRSA